MNNRILLTGASGFLGKIILKELQTDNQIITLARTNSNIIADLTAWVPQVPVCDMVIHTAGKAHVVSKTIATKNDFYNVNFQATCNLLEALEQNEMPKSFVFISTVAVYGQERGSLIDEKSPLLATDPYGDSKIKAEKAVQDWCNKYNVISTILRLPLIAGPNPPGNLKSMINGIKKGYYFNIARGKAKKSMVLAEDVARIIPIAANIGGIYNLTDGYHPSFSELSQIISSQLGKSRPLSIPMWLAACMANAGDLIGSKAPINADKLIKLTTDLTFDDSKARKSLGWEPASVLSRFNIT